MRRERVESTSVTSMGYDAGSATLEIEFAGGGVYRYLGVPPATWDQLRVAESKGRFVNAIVKKNYRFEPGPS